jgi:hypothetical protein
MKILFLYFSIFVIFLQPVSRPTAIPPGEWRCRGTFCIDWEFACIFETKPAAFCLHVIVLFIIYIENHKKFNLAAWQIYAALPA